VKKGQSKIRSTPCRLFVGVSVALLCGTAADTQTVSQAQQKTNPEERQTLIRSVEGVDLYRAYCASCHGKDGKGHGPVAPALKSDCAGPDGYCEKQWRYLSGGACAENHYRRRDDCIARIAGDASVGAYFFAGRSGRRPRTSAAGESGEVFGINTVCQMRHFECEVESA